LPNRIRPGNTEWVADMVNGRWFFVPEHLLHCFSQWIKVAPKMSRSSRALIGYLTMVQSMQLCWWNCRKTTSNCWSHIHGVTKITSQNANSPVLCQYQWMDWPGNNWKTENEKDFTRKRDCVRHSLKL
jgi:hypothetical protein